MTVPNTNSVVKSDIKPKIYFGARTDIVDPGISYPAPLDVCEYEQYDHFTKVGEGEQDVVVDKRVRLINKCSRVDYINRYRNDVGILNVLRQMREQNIDLFAPIDRNNPNNLELVKDITGYPTDINDANAQLLNAKRLKDDLGSDFNQMFPDLDAIMNLDQERFDAYIKYMQDKYTKKEDVK